MVGFATLRNFAIQQPRLCMQSIYTCFATLRNFAIQQHEQNCFITLTCFATLRNFAIQQLFVEIKLSSSSFCVIFLLVATPLAFEPVRTLSSGGNATFFDYRYYIAIFLRYL